MKLKLILIGVIVSSILGAFYVASQNVEVPAPLVPNVVTKQGRVFRILSVEIDDQRRYRDVYLHIEDVITKDLHTLNMNDELILTPTNGPNSLILCTVITYEDTRTKRSRTIISEDFQFLGK